jgi:hypothetical protein
VIFVYRAPYDGPLSQRSCRLPDETVLGWFQRNWRTGDPDALVQTELGGDVYGMESIFEAAAEHDLPVPATTADLRSALHEHLYVEGSEDYIRLDDHSLRVRTDDDEVEVAYYFLDDTAVAEAPDRLAYLLHEQWPLPDKTGPSQSFTPDVPVRIASEAGSEDATTYVVLLTHYDGTTLARTTPWAFPGVSLAGLAPHLKAAAPDQHWDPELSVLQECISPGEDTLLPALERCNRWPGFNLNEWPWPGPADLALTSGRQPERSLLAVGEHIAQLAMHCNEPFGYQQWYLFDNAWAATHPDLAQSLLRYAGHWDPLEVSPAAR